MMLRLSSKMGEDMEKFVELYRNISSALRKFHVVQMQQQQQQQQQQKEQRQRPYGSEDGEDGEDDTANAWLYILFVLMFYAFSIVVLMIKYIRREREGCKLEYYYNEFVKRDWYKDKNLYDSTGRRIRFKVVNGNTITKMQEEPNKLARRNSSDYEDSDEYGASEEEAGDENAYSSSPLYILNGKKKEQRNVMVCVGAASIFAESAAMGMAPIRTASHNRIERRAPNLGARPKRSSLKNWPLRNEDEFIEEETTEPVEGRQRTDSIVEDYETIPLAFLGHRNKLVFAKVDRPGSTQLSAKRNRYIPV